MIYLGADHRGFNLKEEIKKFLKEQNYAFEDIGNFSYQLDDDYPDFAFKVSKLVAQNPESYGILICGTGNGMVIAANKIKNIRAALCLSSYLAEQARKTNDANILVLAADLTDGGTAKRIVKTFLETKFLEEERHKRRLLKIKEQEQ
jgi:ribose 5-phosphate isomerase B